ncbi:MAG: hypothetical protein D6807_06825 [Alphaproteobacteria bacterium]|nr:MAG: hypothetical protein D6807_06825 [Alphaproteobacteria bacterium]
MRASTIIFGIITVIAGAVGLYVLKHEVETRRAAIDALERQIAEDSEALRVLRAEWAYLDSPQQIEDRALRHLRLRPPTPDQFIATAGMVPLRNGETPLVATARSDLLLRPRPRLRPQPPPRRGDGYAKAAATVTVFSARMERAIERLGGAP